MYFLKCVNLFSMRTSSVLTCEWKVAIFLENSIFPEQCFLETKMFPLIQSTSFHGINKTKLSTSFSSKLTTILSLWAAIA